MNSQNTLQYIFEILSGNETSPLLFYAVTAFLVSFVAVLIIILHMLWVRLKESEQLKYEFITIIAHKFRTPLTQIKWLTEGLTTKEQDPYKKEDLGEIRGANEQLISLTNTLIELTDSDKSSKGSYELEKVDLCSFVKAIGDEMKSYFHGKNIFFSVKCDTMDLEVVIDKARMEYVFQTVLNNAYMYTGPGKSVEVTVYGDRRHAYVTVSDHGIGISPEDMRNIFTKFYRAENAVKTDTEGFGIGLYMAQAILRRHGGKIFASSAGLGQGSTFTISLKRA